MARMAPSVAPETMLFDSRHAPAPLSDETRIPTREARTRFEVATTSRMYDAPTDDDAGRRCALDDVAGQRRVGLDRDAVAALVDRLVLAAEQVAHEVALHDRKAPAVVEVGDRDAGRRRVDEIVGDERAFEAELGIDAPPRRAARRSWR